MLLIKDLKMSLSGRLLFENASFGVNYGDRVALVGPNGTGKTTLFSIILKQKEPDSGTVSRDEWTMVGHLHEISERKLIAYSGNYTDYLRQREERYEQQLANHKNQQKEIAALQQFVDRFRAIPSKASQAMSKLKQIERMELIEKPQAPRKPFRFQIPKAG